jgi:hypothetical protein
MKRTNESEIPKQVIIDKFERNNILRQIQAFLRKKDALYQEGIERFVRNTLSDPSRTSWFGFILNVF